jgi:hypothetical protein
VTARIQRGVGEHAIGARETRPPPRGNAPGTEGGFSTVDTISPAIPAFSCGRRPRYVFSFMLTLLILNDKRQVQLS